MAKGVGGGHDTQALPTNRSPLITSDCEMGSPQLCRIRKQKKGVKVGIWFIQ